MMHKLQKNIYEAGAKVYDNIEYQLHTINSGKVNSAYHNVERVIKKRK